MSSPRTDPDALKNRLQKAGLWAKKGLGQHFLIDDAVLDQIICFAELEPGEAVVEIGPGPGALTERLVNANVDLTVFEYDSGMAKILKEDFNIQPVEGNILETAPINIKNQKYKVVANLPYNITNPVLRLFLEATVVPRPRSMTLMLQREVAERLAAPAKTHGRGYLSVLAQYFADVTYGLTVPSAAFWPPPKVQSAVVHLVTKSERLLQVTEEVNFLKFVRRLFIQPRKHLKNVLSGILGVSTSQVEEYFKKLGLPSNVRAQELVLEEWVRLFREPLTV